MWMIRCSLLVLLTWVTVIQGRCSIPMKNGLPRTEPLILRPGVPSGFRNPTKNGILEFSTNEQVRLVCNGLGNHFVNLSTDPKISDVIAKCEKNDKFKVVGFSESIPFAELGCKNWPESEQRVVVPGSCSTNTSYLKYEIGFVLDTGFVKLIEVCHDPVKIVTHYSKFELAKEIGGGRKGRPNVPFREYPEHNICYNDQYMRSSQIATLGKILGSVNEAKKYISPTDRVTYLARGHFVSNADFMYYSQKRATFYYINQAPQWQRCNAQNWFYLERDVRIFASAFDQDLTVYTGVHELAQLPDNRGAERDLYLNFVSQRNKSIPVPRFFWKVIYNEDTQLGTAFVEVNNPYLKLNPIPMDYKICDKFLQNTRWDTWSATNGVCTSYTCEVDELRKFVSFPQFPVRGPLV